MPHTERTAIVNMETSTKAVANLDICANATVADIILLRRSDVLDWTPSSSFSMGGYSHGNCILIRELVSKLRA